MAEFDDIWKEKQKFMLDSEGNLRKSVNGLGRDLWSQVLDKYISLLEVEEGRLISNASNQSLVQSINGIFKDWNDKDHLPVVEGYGKDLLTISSLNETYFDTFSTNSDLYSRTSKSIINDSRRALGLNTSGDFLSGGFLDNFTKDTRIQTELKNLSNGAINSRTPFADFKAQVRELLQGSDARQSRLQDYYQVFAYDTYQTYDRTESNKYAEALGMDAFIYGGGKIATTRQFCCQRNGLIWTKEEASKWKTLRFDGKPKNYDPLRDLGGFGCRHTTQWISNEVAARRRKDLELDEDGELVYVEGVERQKPRTTC